MADLAVGAVSLGIQLSRELAWYLGAVKDRKQEVRSALAETKQLGNVLSALNELLPHIPEVASDLAEPLTQAENALGGLKRLLLDLEVPLAVAVGDLTIKEKAKEKWRTAVYPFKKDELGRVRRVVMDINSILQTALSIANMRYSRLQKDRTEDSGAHVLDLSATLRDNILQVQKRNEELLVDMRASMRETLSEIADQVEEIHRITTSTQSMQEQSMEMHHDSMKMLSLILTRLQTVQPGSSVPVRSAHASMLQLGTTVPPSGLKAVCDQASTSMEMSRPPDVTDGRGPGTCRYCSWRPHRKRNRKLRQFALGVLEIRQAQEDATGHDASCPLFIRSKVKATYDVKAAVGLGGFIRFMITAGFCSTTGAGGFAISRSPTIINLVQRSDSPVAALTDWTIEAMRGSSVSQSVELIRKLERDIFTAFREGRASPHDRICESPWESRSLVEEVLENIVYDTRSISNILLDRKVYAAITDLCASLVESGSTLSWLNYLFEIWDYRPNGPPLSKFLDHADLSDALFDVTFIEGLVSLCNALRRAAKAFPAIFEDLGMPRILRAIILRSTPDLTSSLASASYPVLETFNIFQPSEADEPLDPELLTWAVISRWPKGLALLLKHGVKCPRGEDWQTPESMAIFLRQKGCLQALLDLRNESFWMSWYDLINEASRCGWRAGVSLLIAHISDQATILAAVARDRLPQAQLQEILGTEDWESSRIPDSELPMLCDALQQSGYPVPAALVPPPNLPSLLFFKSWRPIAHLLIRHGYLWTEEVRNAIGLTPLTDCDSWADDTTKGYGSLMDVLPIIRTTGELDSCPRDILELGFSTSATGWHYLAASLGKILPIIFSYSSKAYYFGPPNLRAGELLVAIRDEFHAADKCRCWCSGGGGCKPFLSMARAWAASYPRCATNDFLAEYYANFCRNSHHVLLGHDLGTDPESAAQSLSSYEWVVDLVRLLTFEALEMPHTCCRMGCVQYPESARPDHENMHNVIMPWFSDDEEAQAVHEEGAERATVLERLMVVFEEQLAMISASPLALEEFVWGSWRDTMAEQRRLDEGKVAAMKKFLVKVETDVIPDALLNLLRPSADGQEFDFHGQPTTRPPCPWCEKTAGHADAKDGDSSSEWSWGSSHEHESDEDERE